MHRDCCSLDESKALKPQPPCRAPVEGSLGQSAVGNSPAHAVSAAHVRTQLGSPTYDPKTDQSKFNLHNEQGYQHFFTETNVKKIKNWQHISFYEKKTPKSMLK